MHDHIKKYFRSTSPHLDIPVPLIQLMQAHSYRSSDGKEARDQSGSSSHKSQDAAVGSLVNLLKSARPLRDSTYSSQSGAESNVAGSTSSGMSRRTSDALEELQSFKAIRERLLSGSRAKDGQSPETP
jgi:autophagy-related protein 13